MSDEEGEEEGSDGLEGLLLAAKEGDVATFKQLLRDGEDVLQKDKNDQTVLHWASRSGAIGIIMAGVSKGLTLYINTKSKRGLTPLHDACLAGHIKATHMLIALGAEVTAQTKEGYTPLLCAAGNGHPEVVRLLVGAGCDPNQLVPPIGVSAVHIATWTGQADALDVLLQLGARTNDKSKIGKTASEFAEEQDHTECLDILKKHTSQEAASHASEIRMLKLKMRRVEEKIRDYFEGKLRQEITYFEKQLQDQHEEDLAAAARLQLEVARLQSILGREQAQLLRGQPLTMTRSHQRPDLADPARVPTAPPRPGHPVRRHRLHGGDAAEKLARSWPPDGGTGNGEEEEEEDEREDRPDTTAGTSPKRLPSARGKSISALVEETSRSRTSMTYMRQTLDDDPSRDELLRTASGGSLGLPARPLMGAAQRQLSLPGGAPGPTIRTQADGPFSEISSPAAAPFGSAAASGMERLHVAEAETPRTRRKSLTMLLRPVFFGSGGSGGGDGGQERVDKSRRRSVVTRMPVDSPRDGKSERKRKGPSLLQRALPGIHAVPDIQEIP